VNQIIGLEWAGCVAASTRRLARNPRIELAAIAHPTALSLDVAAFSPSIHISRSLRILSRPPNKPHSLAILFDLTRCNHGKRRRRARARLFTCDSRSAQSSTETGLPEGWEVRRSNTKNLPYYFHFQTKDSRWEPPAGTDPEKLKQYMAAHHSSKGVAPASVANSGDKIRCAHLLVKHRDSRRPASWREPKITRSKEEARVLIEDYEKQIKAYEGTAEVADAEPKSLSELATTESDCSSARKGGDL
jgi:NIMA-interacting peptidyl-prolyl cis-trans isomerase 1